MSSLMNQKNYCVVVIASWKKNRNARKSNTNKRQIICQKKNKRQMHFVKKTELSQVGGSVGELKIPNECIK